MGCLEKIILILILFFLLSFNNFKLVTLGYKHLRLEYAFLDNLLDEKLEPHLNLVCLIKI